MTSISARPEIRESEGRPANDNLRARRAGPSVLDLIQVDHDPDIGRRTERLGVAVVIAMALGLSALPLIYSILSM